MTNKGVFEIKNNTIYYCNKKFVTLSKDVVDDVRTMFLFDTNEQIVDLLKTEFKSRFNMSMPQLHLKYLNHFIANNFKVKDFMCLIWKDFWCNDTNI